LSSFHEIATALLAAAAAIWVLSVIAIAATDQLLVLCDRSRQPLPRRRLR